MERGVDFIGVAAGAMIFNEEGKVFISKRGPLARNEKGKWEFPGGAVEFGEKCEDAIKREVKEEFDMNIEITAFLHLVDHIIPEEKQHWVAPTYIAKYISGTPKIMEPEKCEEFKWISINEINPKLLSLISAADFLEYKNKYGEKSPKLI